MDILSLILLTSKDRQSSSTASEMSEYIGIPLFEVHKDPASHKEVVKIKKCDLEQSIIHFVRIVCGSVSIRYQRDYSFGLKGSSKNVKIEEALFEVVCVSIQRQLEKYGPPNMTFRVTGSGTLSKTSGDALIAIEVHESTGKIRSISERLSLPYFTCRAFQKKYQS